MKHTQDSQRVISMSDSEIEYHISNGRYVDNTDNTDTDIKQFVFRNMPPYKGNRRKSDGQFVAKKLRHFKVQQPFGDNAQPMLDVKEPRPPHAWEYSVYYWWWEFLRRHKGFQTCCERGGVGKYAKLYADWGNIHNYTSAQFWDWWSERVEDEDGDLIKRGEYLFGEVCSRRPAVANQVSKDVRTLTVNIPLEVEQNKMMRYLRTLLNEQQEQRKAARAVITSRYPYLNKVPTKALWSALRTWDVEQRYKDTNVKRYNRYELVTGHKGETRQEATRGYKRMLDMADDYIHFAALGEFPKRRTAAERKALKKQKKSTA